MKKKKIVIACDSFKGCLSSKEVADAIETGILSVFSSQGDLPEIVKVNVADGGEGTVCAIAGALGGKVVEMPVHDPLMRIINARYGIVNTDTAIIEIAEASGLSLLEDKERNPLLTGTYGTGEQILDALQRGCRKFIMGLGGSATNDAGTGLLKALGFKFFDDTGEILDGCGESLGKIARICPPENNSGILRYGKLNFSIACDVDTPFCGAEGAAYVFAPQKGATPEMVEELDKGMASFAKVIDGQTGIDITSIPGAGAAGGLGGGLYALLGKAMGYETGLVPGAELIMHTIGFDKIIRDADLVITGEGKIDRQTALGKAPAVIARHAARFGIPVIAIGGSVEGPMCENSVGTVAKAGAAIFTRCYAVTPVDMPLKEAMRKDTAIRNIVRTAKRIAAVYIISGKKTMP